MVVGLGPCLARTNWDVPKHRGLALLMVKIDQPGIEVHRIEMLNGSKEFCQEFITDVRIPDADRIGRGRRRLDRRHPLDVLREELLDVPAHHPPGALGGEGSPSGGSHPLVGIARAAGRLEDPLGPGPDRRGPHPLARHPGLFLSRAVQGHRHRQDPPTRRQALTRVMGGDTRTRTSTIEFELRRVGRGRRGLRRHVGPSPTASGFLTRQTATIAGRHHRDVAGT